MWQTKYSSVVPKNLGVGVDFWPCSAGDFLTRHLYSVYSAKASKACSGGIYCIVFQDAPWFPKVCIVEFVPHHGWQLSVLPMNCCQH